MVNRHVCLTLGLVLVAALWQPACAQSRMSGTQPPQAAPAGRIGSSAASVANAAPVPAAAKAAAAANASVAPTGDLRRYVVEVVIFRARVALGSPEDWAAETGMAATVAGGEALSGTGVGQLVAVLPPSQYHLNNIAQNLRASRAYRPIAHAAWVQTASAWGTHAGFTLQQLGIDVPGLTGEVILERGQYLHLGMTLHYTEAQPPAGLAPAGTTFVLNENRRVRYYQRNYYDNPAFGVIALVLPAAGPQPPGR